MEKHVQMLLFFCGVFMTSVHTLKWTNVPVELGQDTILNCSLDLDDIIWNIMKLVEGPVKILRMFNKKVAGGSYFNETFKDRYSVKLGNRLFIHNVTVEDRLFYCTTADNIFVFKEIFHLVSAAEQPTCQACKETAELPTKDHQMCNETVRGRLSSLWPNGPLTIVCLVLNFLLIASLAGFYLSARRHNRPSHPDSDLSPLTPPLTPPGSPTLAVYEEIPSRTLTRRNQTSPQVGAVSQVPPGASSGPDCVYSKVQLPSGAGSEPHSIYSKVQMHSGFGSASGSSSDLHPTSLYAKVQKPVSTPTVQ